MKNESTPNLDIFYNRFNPVMVNSVWGQGETGYDLVIFSSHKKEEVEKALAYFKTLDRSRYYVV